MTYPASLGDIQLKLYECMDGRRKEQTMRTLLGRENCRQYGDLCANGDRHFSIARPPSSTSSFGKPMPMRMPNAMAPARASVCMPRRVKAAISWETSAYAV